jgi:ribosomal protein L11 methyltransferase
MTDAFIFEILVEPQRLEELLTDGIGDGFLGYGEEKAGKKLKISFYYDSFDSAKNILEILSKNYGASRISKVENRDWNEEWKKTVTPIKITDKIWVSPKWLEPNLGNTEAWIKIEPQMAFGTGHHETTRIAAKLISQESDKKTLLDIGTGSGVLAFVAQIVGYKSVMGIEIDRDCEENLAQNLGDNRGPSDIRFIIGGMEKISNSAKFDTVVMNMIRSESVVLLANICKVLQKDGRLLWSGILLEEKEIVIWEAQKYGFKLQGEIIENEWWGGSFAR